MPLASDIFRDLGTGRVFSRLDLKDSFFNLSLREEDREKTAFRAGRNGALYEFTVCPQGARNSTASFQRLMNTVLAGLESFAVSYVDDTIIWSTDPATHARHLTAVLDRFRAHGLYINTHKAELFRTSTVFLGVRVDAQGLHVSDDNLRAVREYPAPSTLTELRSLLGFFSFCRPFCRGFSAVSAPLTDLLRQDATPANGSLPWRPEHHLALDRLKQLVLSAPVLRLPDTTKPYTIEIDASARAYGGVLSQMHDGKLHPVAFLSRKMPDDKQHLSVRDMELYALVHCLREWRTYVHGSPGPTEVITDHASLQYLQTQSQLTGTLARAYEQISEYDIIIRYRAGSQNGRADALSRLANGPVDSSAAAIIAPPMPAAPRVPAAAPPAPAVTVVASAALAPPSDSPPAPSIPLPSPPALPAFAATLALQPDCSPETLTRIHASYASDPQLQRWLATTRASKPHKNFVLTADGTLMRRGAPPRVVVGANAELRTDLLRRFHEHPLSAHIGADKLLQVLRQRFYWPNMEADCRDFVASCDPCTRNKVDTRAPAGLLSPLPVPSRPFEQVSMDFLGPFAPSARGNCLLLVIVDSFSKWVILHAAPAFDAPAAAEVFFRRVMLQFGTPNRLITDRDSRWTAEFTQSLLAHCNVEVNMSTAQHPETDGATERVNRQLLEKLRTLVDHDQHDWDTMADAVTHAINASPHSAHGLSPAEVLLGYPLRLPWDGVRSADPTTAPAFYHQHRAIFEKVRAELLHAQELMVKYANKHRRQEEFNEGDMVFVRADRLRDETESARPGTKLRNAFNGPYPILKKLSDVVYRLQLPPSSRAHPVFHIRHLRRKLPTPERFASREPVPLPPPVPEEPQLFEVEQVLQSRTRRARGHVLRELFVSWKGYGPHHNSWVSASNFESASRKLQQLREQQATASPPLDDEPLGFVEPAPPTEIPASAAPSALSDASPAAPSAPLVNDRSLRARQAPVRYGEFVAH